LVGEGGAVLTAQTCFSIAAILLRLDTLDCEALCVSAVRIVPDCCWPNFASGGRGVVPLATLVPLAVFIILGAEALSLVGIRDWWGIAEAVRVLARRAPVVLEGRSVLDTRVNVEALLLVDDIPVKLLISISETFWVTELMLIAGADGRTNNVWYCLDHAKLATAAHCRINNCTSWEHPHLLNPG
jgi:hypothetical protein